jgi:hypothetical protein
MQNLWALVAQGAAVVNQAGVGYPEEVRRVRRSWLRRRAPLILVLVAMAWILTLIVWLTIDPVAGTGNPLD